jgi:thiamine biosynthesis lipoprotein
MEIDLGGIGKEYAVDRAFEILRARSLIPFLINFGGDLRASAAPTQGAWRVGVEHPSRPGATALLLIWKSAHWRRSSVFDSSPPCWS